MVKRSILWMASSAIVLLLALTLIGVQPDTARADGFGGWSCPYTIQAYPISNGTLSARGCSSTYECACTTLLWQVWSDTYPSYSVWEIYTYVAGSDSCNGGQSYTFQMSTSHNDYSSNYGTSGSPAQGAYQNCLQGQSHVLRAQTSNYVLPASVSTQWQGTVGYAYF